LGVELLKDKVVVITGAGGGLGRELAKAFCARGAVVVGLGRSTEKLEETRRIIGEGAFELHSADVADFARVEDVVAQIIAKHGRIDLLFNNAAVYPKVSFLEESAQDFAQVLLINVSGVANTCKAILPSMIDSGFGRIFNLGSWADRAPIADSAAYSAAKGAVHALTKAIAVDIAQHDVDVEIHEWLPGHLNTRMSDFSGMDPAVAAEWAVAMASKPHASSRSCIYERDREWQPPKSLKQKLLSRILFWRR
jgi:NAD(P)-dependent dehydrogenase (short-subunit alcohol dehydrogenase family)